MGHPGWAWIALAGCASASPPPAGGGVRVVAAGDLHGDLDNAVAALALAGVVDREGHWAGGETILVQTGDVTDRGPDSRAVMAWLRALQGEARAAGGQVIALLGNHEIMNLRGDWRYVHPGDVQAYGGMDARRAAFGPQGEDGRWLRTLDVAAQVGDTVFVHGGIHPDFASGGVRGLSDRVRQGIDQLVEVPAAGDVLTGESSPTWYRGYVTEPESTACPALARALAQLGARRMVVGHTTQRDGKVAARCGGALLVIDVGIADGYGGHLGVIEIVAGPAGTDARATYPSGVVDLPDPPQPAAPATGR